MGQAAMGENALLLLVVTVINGPLFNNNNAYCDRIAPFSQ